MYIYNVTVNVEDSVHTEWLTWMKEDHIPAVMATGCFVANRMLRLLSEIENNGITYGLQYYFDKMEDYVRYQDKYAAKLQEEHKQKFDGKFVAFRTLLEIVE